jgi:transposase
MSHQKESKQKKRNKKIRQEKLDELDADSISKSRRLSKMPKTSKGKRNNETPYDESRMIKAKIILSKQDAVQEINGELFLVKSQTGIGNYRVEWNGMKWVCKCPDFTKNGHIHICKHIQALELYLDCIFSKIDKTQLIPDKTTYKQDWPRYNQAQVMEFDLFDQFLHQLVSLIEEPERKKGKGRPRLKLADRIFCCVMKEYSLVSSRRAQHLYHEAMQCQQISCNPHFNVVSRTLNQKELTPLLRKLVQLSSQPMASIDANLAVDSSGFTNSTYKAYYEHVHGEKRKRRWLKAHICIGTYTNIVTDMIVTDEHAADSPQFEKLIRNTARYFDIGEVSADMAYSSRENYEIVSRYGGKAYIPFKKNATGSAHGSQLWHRMFHYFQYNMVNFMEHYHKRSNVEATFNAIKQKFNEIIKSKNRIAQKNELYCKIIAYNLTVLIHEMIKLDGISDFMRFDGLNKEI